MRKITLALTAVALLALTGCSAGSPSPADAASEQRTVVYDVTSDAATSGNVTYLTFNAGAAGQEQATDAPLPFTKEIVLDDDALFESSIFSLVAQAAVGATTISCKITVDGEVISEQTSTGEYAVVSCSGSAS
jgi:hypothetical protein